MENPQVIITLKTKKPATVETLMSKILKEFEEQHPEIGIDWQIHREPIVIENEE